MWLLNELCAPWLDSKSCPDIVIQAISNQSKSVTTGALFLAYKNHLCDRVHFIDEAIANGASAIVIDAERKDCQQIIERYHDTVPVIALNHLQQIYGELAARFYHNPTEKMTVIGVTGTNGKSSTAYYIAQAFNLLGKPCAFIGTFGIGLPNQLVPSPLTTLDPIVLQQQAAEFVKQHIHTMVIEMSSHALDQGRLNGVHVDTTVLTQITSDHLDYHKTLENYHLAKEKSMQLPYLKHAVINADDAVGAKWIYTYHDRTKMIAYAKDVKTTPCPLLSIQQVSFAKHKLHIDYEYHQTFSVEVALLGSFNVENISACVATLLMYDFSESDITAIMPNILGAPGRLECFMQQGMPTIFVDYAHTEDGLNKVLAALNEHQSGKLSIVFGCGGDRDNTKRAPMGHVATQYAQHIWLTNDNPRTEDPQQIIEHILQGIKQSTFDMDKVHVELDREQCITQAIKAATVNDVILIAGKGHETMQKMNGFQIECDDRKIVQHLLNTLKID